MGKNIQKITMLVSVYLVLSCSTTDNMFSDDFLYRNVEYSTVEIPETIETENGRFVKSWLNDFNSESEDWGRGDWIFDTNECEFTPQMAVIKDGLLRLGIMPVNSKEVSRKDYWGGEYFKDIEPVQYGRFAVRMKPQVPKGVVASFFLAHYDFNDDYTGMDENSEIDIEFCGASNEVQLAIHYVNKEGDMIHADAPIIKLDKDISENFHLWEIEWMPNHIKYYLDGELIHTVLDQEVLEEMEFPMTTRMNYWISNSVPWVGKFNKDTLPLVTYYDYVAFYKWENS